MPTTVYFATNRVVTDPSNAALGYGSTMVPPSSPDAMTYGTAFVDGINISTNAQGKVSQISDTRKGGFSEQARTDIAKAGRNLLLFIHGFDNSFSDAITRAAFNREWLAGSGVVGADTTVIAFSWPSKGELIAFPILKEDYLGDQHMARNSGAALMSFFAELESIMAAARANRQRVILLAHSMGNLALQAGVESWFLHGQGDTLIFDLAILAAGDCRYDVFDQPGLAGLSGLVRLAQHVSIYYSGADQVLQLSMVVNLGAKRLGQDGPRNRSDTALFPAGQHTMVDCTGYRDYDFNVPTSHQYYRLSPTVRTIIAGEMGGPLVA
jgi:esterase/lipase superfamily enzyme